MCVRLESFAPMQSPPRTGPLIAVAVALFALVAVYHVASARAGYSHVRDLHLSAALEYAKGPIDLLRPVIVGFNVNGAPTPQEFPLWQALAGVTFKVLGTSFVWANLLSLALFAAGFWPLYRLASVELGPRGGWWALIFLIVQPILILISGQASADGLSLVLSIWFAYFAERLIRTGKVGWVIPATIFGVLSAVSKIPLFMSVGLLSFGLLLTHARKLGAAWLRLSIVGVVSGVAFLFWTRYIGWCHGLSELPFSEPPSGDSVWQWYIGDLAFRLNPFNWAKGGWAALNCLLGSFALAALAVWALFFARCRMAQLWFLAALATTFVFAHVVLVHRHYYVLFSPAVALLCAAAMIRLEELLHLEKPWQRGALAGGAFAILLACALQGLIGIEIVLDHDPYRTRIIAAIRENTNADEKLLIRGGGGGGSGWGAENFFLADRKGLAIRNTQLLEDPATLARLQTLGFTKLVMISEPPLLHALQQVNPGSLDRQRLSYTDSLTPVVDPWPTLVKTDDLLIKQIPAIAP